MAIVNNRAHQQKQKKTQFPVNIYREQDFESFSYAARFQFSEFQA